MDNVLKELKDVKWKTLGRDWDGDVLLLPSSQRCKIVDKYAGETERKRGVKYWLWHNPYASWRWFITRLDKKEEHAAADQMCGYAEKLTGMLGSSLHYWQ